MHAAAVAIGRTPKHLSCFVCITSVPTKRSSIRSGDNFIVRSTSRDTKKTYQIRDSWFENLDMHFAKTSPKPMLTPNCGVSEGVIPRDMTLALVKLINA